MPPVSQLIGATLTFLLWVTSLVQAQVLTIGPDAQSLAFNEAVTAELLGASSLYVNPANLAFEKSSSLSATYTLWIGDLQHTHAALNLKKGSRALAFGFWGSHVNDIPLRGNQAGPPEGSFNVSSLSLSSGYARRWGPIAIGAAIQYLREEFYIYNASGFAANLGASARLLSGRITLGTSLTNLGKMDDLRNESTDLPTTYRAGFDARLLTFKSSNKNDFPVSINLKNDVIVPLRSQRSSTQSNASDEVYTNIALELAIAETIAIRSGYKTGKTVRRWSAGVGMSVNSFTANYAVVPFKTGFGTAHSIGIQYRF